MKLAGIRADLDFELSQVVTLPLNYIYFTIAFRESRELVTKFKRP